MDGNHLVTKSHQLIEARQLKPLSAREQKIILTMVSMIQPDDVDFKEYHLSIKAFNELLGLKGHAKYEEIKEVALNLQTKTLYIPDAEGFTTTNWVASQQYREGEGVIKFTFSPHLKPYLLQLKTHFTSYKLSNILSLGSGYSIRLYELMKKWQLAGKWDCSVTDLRSKFGIDAGSYNRYTHFKNRILKGAIEEVNEKTDLHIEFTEIKKGRKVEAISFIIKRSPGEEIETKPPIDETPNEVPKPTEQELRLARFNELAEGYMFDTTFFAQLYEGAVLIWGDDAEQELEWLISYVNSSTSIKNPHGFIQFKLKSAWKIHEAGGYSTFVNLKDTDNRPRVREEKLPEWFTQDAEPGIYEPKTSPELDAEKEKLLKKLAEKKNGAPNANK